MPLLLLFTSVLIHLGSPPRSIKTSARSMYCRRRFGFLRITPTLHKAMHNAVKPMIKIVHKRYLLSMEATLARGNFKTVLAPYLPSPNPTQSFGSTANSPQQSCNLLCFYFPFMFTFSTTTSSTAILDPDCSKSFVIHLFTPSLVEFLIFNLDKNS